MELRPVTAGALGMLEKYDLIETFEDLTSTPAAAVLDINPVTAPPALIND